MRDIRETRSLMCSQIQPQHKPTLETKVMMIEMLDSEAQTSGEMALMYIRLAKDERARHHR